MADYKVVITTSGIGSRLGELTDYTNKSLVRIDNRPVISHIVEYYPKDVEIVVTLGYHGKQVKDYLELAYNDRKFTFVTVNNYDKPGSSLGLSLLTAKDELQCPFIFHACDTVVKEDLPINWVLNQQNFVIGNLKQNADQYRTIEHTNHKLTSFKEKGELKSTDSKKLVYIGLAGIYNYKTFWTELESTYLDTPNNSSLSDCHVINRMIRLNYKFDVIEFKRWYDIGNSTELMRTRKSLYCEFDLLDKVDESIFIVNDSVIKFFYNESIVRDRVARAELLKGLVPEIEGVRGNFFKYKKAHGSLFAKTVTEPEFNNFLNWLQTNLWTPTKAADFKSDCYEFYYTKTKDRIKQYIAKTFLPTRETVINGLYCESVNTILKNVNQDWLTSGIPCKFHGDCILDNVIQCHDNTFTLIDWRQNFNGKLYGDVYYDLAKLNHNLTFNHELVANSACTIKLNETSDYDIDILCSNKLQGCQQELHKFIVNNGYDLQKVKFLTALIWINMAPLHNGLDHFLYRFGQWHLNKIYKEIKDEQNIKTSNTVNKN